MSAKKMYWFAYYTPEIDQNKKPWVHQLREGQAMVEFPFGVLASMEMAGRLILGDADNFRNTTWADVVSAFRKSGLTRHEIESLLG